MCEMGEKLWVDLLFFCVYDGVVGVIMQIGGCEYLNFVNYNYLGLVGDLVVFVCVKVVIDCYGILVFVSWMVVGECLVQCVFECVLVVFYEIDDCVVFVSGYVINVIVIGVLFGFGDLVVYDVFVYNSIVQGVQLSGVKWLSFLYNDWQVFDELLLCVCCEYWYVLIVIEGLYSMDGDFFDLQCFVDVKMCYGVFLLVDEVYLFGVFGVIGKGICEYCGVVFDQVDMWMGMMSKMLVGCGGFIVGCQLFVDMLCYLVLGFLYSVGFVLMFVEVLLVVFECLQVELEWVV